MAATLPALVAVPCDDAFLKLDAVFLTRLPAALLLAPYVVGFSDEVAAELGLDPSIRALTVGEIEHEGRRFERQFKGTGRTPYSRIGSGRTVLRSSIREFLCSEAMHHLGIPTTRVAESFVRFDHFEHFFSNDLPDLLKQLSDHVIDRFYPTCRGEAEDPYLALLETVMQRTARIIAQWQAVGFCHGVMNTDNMSILGLTLDYGPFGFVDAFDAGHICNHTDQQGRYAYRIQPRISYWN